MSVKSFDGAVAAAVYAEESPVKCRSTKTTHTTTVPPTASRWVFAEIASESLVILHLFVYESSCKQWTYNRSNIRQWILWTNTVLLSRERIQAVRFAPFQQTRHESPLSLLRPRSFLRLRTRRLTSTLRLEPRRDIIVALSPASFALMDRMQTFLSTLSDSKNSSL